MGRGAYDTTGTLMSQQNTSAPTNGVPTQVLLVSGKKANQAYRTALSLHRENASLSEATILPKTHVEKENPQHDQPKEA